MSKTHQCPQCGAEVPADAPEGLCPNCVLKAGLQSGGDSLAGMTASGSVPPSDSFVAPTPAELTAYFPDLDILELVGRGGMGVVYKARQKHLDRLVALKILAPSVGKDMAFAERFAREARAMAMLSHPHIVTIYDFGQTTSPRPYSGEGPGVRVAGGEGGLYYFLMEFVDGLTLRQLLNAGKLAPPEALAIVPQICEALQFAHDKGVVHRDIKPENILMDKSGQVKIADFGLAKLVGQEAKDFTLTGAGQVLGTPHYMAPEQTEHPQDVDHRADIYSLGVVFYQMLTGELPLGRFAPPSKTAQIDVRLDEVVLRALENEPKLRYQQARDVKSEVETIARTRSHGSWGQARPEWKEWSQWRRYLRGRLLTPVGTRGGKPVIHWRAVLFSSLGLFGAILSPFVLLMALPELFGAPHKEPPGQLLIAELFAGVVAAIAMTLFVRWQLRRPLTDLPDFDRSEESAQADEKPQQAWFARRVQLVGVRCGKRVIIWPEVGRVYVIPMAWGLILGGVLFVRSDGPSTAGGICITAAFFAIALGILIRRELRRPISELPNLEPQETPSTREASRLDAKACGPGQNQNNGVRAEGFSPRVLNVGNCRIATPESLATFDGQFFFCRNMGQLVLDERQLTFSGAGMYTVISLAAIRDLSIGRFPRVMNPAGLTFMSVTYEDGGQNKRIILSPFEGLVALPWHFNQLVAHWFDAIRAAVTAAMGREPPSTPAGKLGTPPSSVGVVAMIFIPLLIGVILFCFCIGLLMQKPEPPRVLLIQPAPARVPLVLPPPSAAGPVIKQRRQ